MKSLAAIAAEKPFPAYLPWWQLGREFVRLMRAAILPAWSAAKGGADFATVKIDLENYLRIVYGCAARRGLLSEFVDGEAGGELWSGEFDALSYAFFRSAFSALEPHERRGFTRQVGAAFFKQLAIALSLDIPLSLRTASDLDRFTLALNRTGAFLVSQRYLRDHFSFELSLAAVHQNRPIIQRTGDFLTGLNEHPPAYGLYVMGFPVILPSAVYLYHTMGEAQHHSSRIIEELFAAAGCSASETADFNPTGFPPDRVVELWEIRPSSS